VVPKGSIPVTWSCDLLSCTTAPQPAEAAARSRALAPANRTAASSRARRRREATRSQASNAEDRAPWRNRAMMRAAVSREALREAAWLLQEFQTAVRIRFAIRWRQRYWRGRRSRDSPSRRLEAAERAMPRNDEGGEERRGTGSRG